MVGFRRLIRLENEMLLKDIGHMLEERLKQVYPDRLLSFKEVRERLKIQDSKLREMLDTGDLPSIKGLGCLKVSEYTLNTFIKRKEGNSAYKKRSN